MKPRTPAALKTANSPALACPAQHNESSRADANAKDFRVLQPARFSVIPGVFPVIPAQSLPLA